MKQNKATKKRKRRLHNLPPKTWNLSEILYAFTGFLTTRGHPLIFSARHDAAPIAQMVAQFIVANGLPGTRADWPKVQIPPGTDHLTNVPENAVAMAPLEPAEAVKKIAGIIYSQDRKRQDLVLASVLEQVRTWRQDSVNVSRTKELGAQLEASKAQDELNRLESVIRGDFAILYPVNKPNG